MNTDCFPKLHTRFGCDSLGSHGWNAFFEFLGCLLRMVFGFRVYSSLNAGMLTDVFYFFDIATRNRVLKNVLRKKMCW